jgi:hypothetical protein
MSHTRPGGWCIEVMIKAGEWSNNPAQFLESTPGGGPDLPKQRAAVGDFSLAALVRQWLTTSEAVERKSRPEGDDSPLRPTWTPPKEDPLANVALVAPVVEDSPTPAPVDRDTPTEPAAEPAAAPEAPGDVPLPVLPRRRKQPQRPTTRRLAVLIHAETTTAESAEALFDLLADQGAINVCRAYADWTSSDARGWWSAPLRQHGIQPHHQFGDGQDQRSLVALTVDAVDLAREGAVDAVVIVGDLVSLHPLVVRLNASGLQVLAFGTTPTPDDVRALCHEFVDLSSGGGLDAVPTGKHRA